MGATGLLTGLVLLSVGAAASAIAAVDQDRRGQELVRFSCSSAGGEHQLTLFGNGTLRLRERRGRAPKPVMLLAELTPDELDAYVNRLKKRPYDRVHETLPGGPNGEWVEQCSLVISVEPGDPVAYRFSRIESLPLDLAHLLTIAEELLVDVRGRSAHSNFPAGYEPRPGDVLVRVDGSRFRIERFTADGRGLEISGIDEPLVLYVEASQVTGAFFGLAEDGGRR